MKPGLKALSDRLPLRRWPLVLAALAMACHAGCDKPSPLTLDGVWQIRPKAKLLAPKAVEGVLTPHGAERLRSTDYSRNPALLCMPPGPFAPFTWPMPFQIVQSRDTVVFLYEGYSAFRIVSLKETSHPADISDYPEWMGHSIGRFEGRALVVDTVGIDDRSWLTNDGLQHSTRLHMVERFERLDLNSIKYSYVLEDPVYFKEPVRGEGVFHRQDTRIMSYWCMENEKDRGRAESVKRGDPRVDWKMGHFRERGP